MRKDVRGLLLSLGVATVILIVQACGAAPSVRKDAANNSSSNDQTYTQDELNAAAKDKVTPSKAYYEYLLKYGIENMHSFALAGAPHTLFVKFDGATVKKGYGPRQSYLLCKQTATIPAAGFSAAEQGEIVSKIQGFFDNANALLNVTLDQPTAGEYTMVIVGGAYTDLGCDADDSLLGISPFDDGNLNDSDVAFVFTDKNPTWELAAVEIAHEAGHTYGLDHVDNQASVMYPIPAAAATGFLSGQLTGSTEVQDGAAILQKVLGEKKAPDVTPVPTTTVVPTTTPDPSTPTPTFNPIPTGLPIPSGIPIPSIPGIPGADILAVIANMIEELQKSGNINDVLNVVITNLNTLVPGGTSGLPGFDKVIAVLNLVIANVNSGTPMDASKIFDLVNDIMKQLGLSSIPYLDQLKKLLGGFDVNDIITSIIDLLKGINGGTFPLTAAYSSANYKADLSLMLGISKNIDIVNLVSLMKQHKDFIVKNYQGTTKEAMLSLLKAAYTQAYSSMQH